MLGLPASLVLRGADAPKDAMQLVPFDASWTGSETKEDLKAWYRRPSVYGGFSVIGPLPLRRHTDWQRKGYEYVTLGSSEDVVKILPQLRAKGVDTQALGQSYDHNGHFKLEAYLKAQRVKDDTYVADLQAKVDKFGYDAVAEMLRVGDPNFVMPPAVKAPEAKAKAKVN